MNKYEIAKFCAEAWAEGSGHTPEPGHVIQYMQENAGVPIESWIQIPPSIKVVPIPQIVYDPHDVDADKPGISLDPENKLIKVACSDGQALSHFLFTWI